MDEVVGIVLSGVNAVWNWFGVITSHIPGAIEFWLGMMAIMLSYRFLLLPLLSGRGVGGSDRVKKSKKSSDQE